MKVIFIHHSCFLVEAEGKVLLFDWFAGDKVKEYQFHGILPEYPPDTPFYVFASHNHRDHFDMDVLHLAERYHRIRFIFSKDCKLSPNFLKKHGFPENIREKILYVGGCASYQLEGLEIETLRSTDAGVAFYVDLNGVTLFHAGDLNNWRWEGAGEIVNGAMDRNYKSQINRIAKKPINLAFVPMDPRLGQYQTLGMDYVLQHTDAEHVFPMHMWQDYSAIGQYKKKISNAAMAGRVMEVTHENQVFVLAP